MDQFDKETNKSHYRKAYCCCHGNLLELCKKQRKISSGRLMYGTQTCTAVTEGEISLYRTMLTLETLQNLHRCWETNPLFQKTDEIFREKMQISTKNGQSQSFLNKQNQKLPQWQFMEHLSHCLSFTSLQALKIILNAASKMENLYLCVSQKDSTISLCKNRVLGTFSIILGQHPWSWLRRSTAPQKPASMTRNEVPYGFQKLPANLNHRPAHPEHMSKAL